MKIINRIPTQKSFQYFNNIQTLFLVVNTYLE